MSPCQGQDKTHVVNGQELAIIQYVYMYISIYNIYIYILVLLMVRAVYQLPGCRPRLVAPMCRRWNEVRVRRGMKDPIGESQTKECSGSSSPMHAYYSLLPLLIVEYS
jgi:hypothetical protein